MFAARSSLETQKRNHRNEYEHEETKIGTSATPNKRTKLDHESLQGAQEPMRKGGDDVLSVANSAAPNSKFETETRNTRRARCTELYVRDMAYPCALVLSRLVPQTIPSPCLFFRPSPACAGCTRLSQGYEPRQTSAFLAVCAAHARRFVLRLHMQ